MSIILDAGVAVYVAMAVALSVWIGIFFYLLRIDAQARELRRKLDRQTQLPAAPAPTASLRAQKVENREPRTENLVHDA